MLDELIELGIFRIGDGREEKDEILVSKVLKKFSGGGSDLRLLLNTVFDVNLVICELAVKVEVFWECECFVDV